MKKVLLLLLAVCLLASMANAQSKALNKALQKEYKQKMKVYKKDNWKLFGSSRSLEVALLTHYEKLTRLGDEVREEVGIASRFKSKSVGHQMAINDACVTYAQKAGSHVKGRIDSDMKGDGVDANTEFDRFYAAYERLVEKEIKGEMRESFSVIHDLSDGTYEMESYFIVDEAAASKARVRAMENAARESELAQKYAQQVSNFIREGFKDEKE